MTSLNSAAARQDSTCAHPHAHHAHSHAPNTSCHHSHPEAPPREGVGCTTLPRALRAAVGKGATALQKALHLPTSAVRFAACAHQKSGSPHPHGQHVDADEHLQRSGRLLPKWSRSR